MDRRSLGALALSLAASATAAAVGGLGAQDAPAVYERLDKPAWAPPAGVFGPAWTVLYAGIGVAGWRLWRAGGDRKLLVLHGVQLALNAAWTPVFFGAGARAGALGIILALDVAVAAELAAAAKRDRIAAALLAPYLGWLLYATALNAAVGNPQPGS